jgi:hypothetical protein
MQRYTFAFLWPEKHYQCKGREENYTAIPWLEDLLGLDQVFESLPAQIAQHDVRRRMTVGAGA